MASQTLVRPFMKSCRRQWIPTIVIVTLTICGLVLLQGLSFKQFLYGFFSKHRSTQQQKILIILTQTRSGSSFTGEVFSATKNSIYFYEPLYPYGLLCKPYPEEKQFLLNQMLHCNFTGLTQLYREGFNKSKFPDGASCVNHGLCFAHVSAGLSNRYRQSCRRKTRKYPNKAKDCNGYPFQNEILEDICRSSELVVTKVVRVCSVRDLEDIYESLTANGKSVFILHLVRDLRGIASSNFKISKNKDALRIAKSVVKEYGSRQRVNMVYLKENFRESKIIEAGRYMRLLYEDISSEPDKAAAKVFRFMHFSSVPTEVVQKIHNVLQPSIPRILQLRRGSKTDAMEKIKLIQEQYKQPFGTVRDPKVILNEWRTLMPFQAIRYIQDQCHDVMEEMGYVTFDSENQMENLSRLSFITK